MAVTPISTYEDAFSALPAAYQEKYETALATMRAQIPVDVPNAPPSRTCPITAIVIGSLLIVGSVFFLLAAMEVLPQGLNTISQLGQPGMIIGYAGLALGMIVGTVGGIRCIKVSYQIALYTKGQEIIESGTSDARKILIKNFFNNANLQEYEMVAIEDAENKTVDIFYRYHSQDIPWSESLVYEKTAQEKIDEWKQNQTTPFNCVSLDTLKNRA